MRALLLFAIVGVIAYFAHRHHTESVENAAAAARSAALKEGVEKAQEQALEQARKESDEKAKIYIPVSVSPIIEPLYVEVFGDISSSNPADLVPQLEITRERISDKRGNSLPARKLVDTDARALMTSLIALAEERTKAIEALLRARAAKPTALDSAAASSTSSMFVDGITKRWREERARRKPAIEAQFVKLKQSERDWNQLASPKARPETFDLPILPKLMVTLESGDAARQGMPGYRRNYYQRHGFPGSR